jgi:hypothetical protein
MIKNKNEKMIENDDKTKEKEKMIENDDKINAIEKKLKIMIKSMN